MRQPGIEPGSIAWKATMLTFTPPTLWVYNIYAFIYSRCHQDGRVVKALDLSSNGRLSAWVRTPLLVLPRLQQMGHFIQIVLGILFKEEFPLHCFWPKVFNTEIWNKLFKHLRFVTQKSFIMKILIIIILTE